MAGLVTRVALASVGAVKDARGVLAAGGLVAFPTETVYGVGADATNDTAVAKLYAVKERPSFNPLIAHVADLAAAARLAVFDDAALHLARAFWPGPLTLVLSKADGCLVADLATAGLDTVAIRIPAHPVARDILRAFGGPVVAPSANLSGHVSPTIAAHVQSDLAGRIDLIVDGGAVEVGVESTIVGCFEAPMLLRPGGLPREAIERVLGRTLAFVGDGTSGLLIVGVVVSEMLISSAGIGYLISRYRTILDSPHVFAGVLLVLFMAIAFNAAIRWIERKAAIWQTGTRAGQAQIRAEHFPDVFDPVV